MNSMLLSILIQGGKKKKSQFKLFYQGQEYYLLTVLETLGSPSTTMETPFKIIWRVANPFFRNHAKSHLQQSITHYQAQRMGLVSFSITHASPPPKFSHSVFFKCSVTECSVPEEPLSETSFQRKEAFPKLLCSNFNTDRVCLLFYSRMPQFKNKIARCSAVQNGT